MPKIKEVKEVKKSKKAKEKKPVLDNKRGKAKDVKEKTKTTKKVVVKNNIDKNVKSNSKAAKKVATVKEKDKSKTTKKAVATKTKTNKKTVSKKKEYVPEYYDLPYRYNETVVKILAQTPKRIFVYWEVSDKDKNAYIKAFGEDFFDKTYPVLLVHNEELNYTFEVPINDFANSWYLDIKDPKTKYVVKLGRKFKNVEEIKTNYEVVREENINLQNDFIDITDSNKLETPNDHVLFEKLGNQVSYKNVKNGNEFTKNIEFVARKLGKTYNSPNIKDMYKELYEEEFDLENDFNISNPGSSNMPTSSFK